MMRKMKRNKKKKKRNGWYLLERFEKGGMHLVAKLHVI